MTGADRTTSAACFCALLMVAFMNLTPAVPFLPFWLPAVPGVLALVLCVQGVMLGARSDHAG